jgi:phosphocarrier protein HPr
MMAPSRREGWVMVEKTAIVQNEHGIHCRPSAVIVKAAFNCPCAIRVTAASGETDLKSLLTLVSLGLEVGTAVKIRVSGPDEASWCRRLTELFETRYDFPPRE